MVAAGDPVRSQDMPEAVPADTIVRAQVDVPDAVAGQVIVAGDDE